MRSLAIGAMNQCSRKLLALVALTVSTGLHAQPDQSVIIVRDENGHSMRGTYAPSFAEQQGLGTRRWPAWTVELHFNVSADYPYDPHQVGTHQWWALAPDTVRFHGRRHPRFQVIDCWCERKFLLVRRGPESMRIDLPEAKDEGVERGREPTVIVFKPDGRAR